jgi:hypothetical protein
VRLAAPWSKLVSWMVLQDYVSPWYVVRRVVTDVRCQLKPHLELMDYLTWYIAWYSE